MDGGWLGLRSSLTKFDERPGIHDLKTELVVIAPTWITDTFKEKIVQQAMQMPNRWLTFEASGPAKQYVKIAFLSSWAAHQRWRLQDVDGNVT